MRNRVFTDDFKRSIVQQMELADVEGKNAILREHRLTRGLVSTWCGMQSSAIEGLVRSKSARSPDEKLRIIEGWDAARTNSEKGAILDDAGISVHTVQAWKSGLRSAGKVKASRVTHRTWPQTAIEQVTWDGALEHEHQSLLDRLGAISEVELQRLRDLDKQREQFNRATNPSYAAYFDRLESTLAFVFELQERHPDLSVTDRNRILENSLGQLQRPNVTHRAIPTPVPIGEKPPREMVLKQTRRFLFGDDDALLRD